MSTISRGLRSRVCSLPRWAFPVFCVGLGVVLAGAMAIGHQSGGWWVIGVFVAYGAALFWLSPRSEVAALLAAEVGDERQRSINQQASAATFSALVVVLVAGFLVSTAMGSDVASVFAGLSAFGGLTWVTALVVLTRRG